MTPLDLAPFIPESFAAVSFIIKRAIRDHKLADSLSDEAARRLGQSTIDGDSLEGFRRSILDALEIDGIRRDIQAASLSSLAGTLVLMAKTSNSLGAEVCAIIWGIAMIVNSRFTSFPEGRRTFERLRKLHLLGFLGFWILSVAAKIVIAVSVSASDH